MKHDLLMDFFCFVHVGFFNFSESLEELLRLTALYKGMREAICVYNLKKCPVIFKTILFILVIGSFAISKRWDSSLTVRLPNPNPDSSDKHDNSEGFLALARHADQEGETDSAASTHFCLPVEQRVAPHGAAASATCGSSAGTGALRLREAASRESAVAISQRHRGRRWVVFCQLSPAQRDCMPSSAKLRVYKLKSVYKNTH